MRTLSEALDADGITVRYYARTKGAWRVFDVTVHCEGRSFSFQTRGSADSPNIDPEPVELLAPLIRNVEEAERAESYDEWASRLSDCSEDKLPEEDYRRNLEIAKSLRVLFGDTRYEGYSPHAIEHDD